VSLPVNSTHCRGLTFPYSLRSPDILDASDEFRSADGLEVIGGLFHKDSAVCMPVPLCSINYCREQLFSFAG